MELRFSVDTKHRKDWFTGVSFSHPAKMSLPLQLWIIENYTKAGETILDPMAGSGTVLVACSLGRNVIAVELEQKFIDIMKGNWEKIKQRGPQLGSNMGNCQIIQGDARQLEGLVDKIVTSPPYEGALTSSSQHGNTGIAADNPKLADTGRYKAENPENIGNLKSQSYLEAMLQVYQQCYNVLKPRGLMILVTKNFIRNKQVIRLDTDTIKLCEQAGFSFIERHYRKLPAQSFWRIIYYKKHPEVEQINHEDILVFSKEV